MKKITSVLIVLMLLIGVMSPMLTAHALNKPVVSITATPTTVVIGNQITVTVKHSVADAKIGGVQCSISYNSTVLEYVSSSVPPTGLGVINDAGGKLLGSWLSVDGSSEVVQKIVFKAKKAGTADISVETQEITDVNEQAFPTPDTKKITVTSTSQTPKSTNANLKSVTFSLGGSKGKATLAPAFSSAVTSYTVTVPNDTTSVSIEAIPAEAGKATAKLEGSWAAVDGNWTRKVIVTAEDGVTKKTYTFKIVKSGAVTPPADDKPQTPDVNEDLRVVVNKKEYSIVTNISNVKAPAGFKTDITKYNETEIPCFVSNDKSCTLVALSDGDKTDLFIYDAEHIAFDNCDIADVAGQFVIFDAADFTDEVKDFPTKEVIIGNKTVTTYRFANSGEFVLVWAIGADGEGKLYIYDTVGKTLQRYAKIHNSLSGESDAPILTPPVNDDPQENVIDMQIILLAFGIAGAIILILLVAWIAALVRLKRACPPKNKDVAFVPFFDDDGALTEFDTSFAYENAQADKQETETPAENEETEEETEENE